jgi:hypothetical protein
VPVPIKKGFQNDLSICGVTPLLIRERFEEEETSARAKRISPTFESLPRTEGRRVGSKEVSDA